MSIVFGGYEWIEVTTFQDMPKRVFLRGRTVDDDDTRLDIGDYNQYTIMCDACGRLKIEIE